MRWGLSQALALCVEPAPWGWLPGLLPEGLCRSSHRSGFVSVHETGQPQQSWALDPLGWEPSQAPHPLVSAPE